MQYYQISLSKKNVDFLIYPTYIYRKLFILRNDELMAITDAQFVNWQLYLMAMRSLIVRYSHWISTFLKMKFYQ